MREKRPETKITTRESSFIQARKSETHHGVNKKLIYVKKIKGVWCGAE